MQRLSGLGDNGENGGTARGETREDTKICEDELDAAGYFIEVVNSQEISFMAEHGNEVAVGKAVGENEVPEGRRCQHSPLMEARHS